MSLLAEVLQSAEMMELEQINAAVPAITLAVENCKLKVNTFIQNVYVEFSDNSKRHRMLVNDATRLYSETVELQAKLEQVSSKDVSKNLVDVEAHGQCLKKANLTLSLVLNIQNIHEGLLKVKNCTNSKSYLMAMKECKNIEQFILSTPEDEVILAIDEMKMQYYVQETTLINKLSKSFRDNVVWQVSDEKKSVMKVYRNTEEITEILQALYLYSSSVFLLDGATKFLWQYVFVPIIDCVTDIEITDGGDSTSLEVVIRDSTKTTPYTEVFNNLKKVATYLNDTFCFKLDDRFTSVEYIGQDIKDNLSEHIIKHCLQNTIPSTNEGLEKYKVVIQDTEQLEKVFVDCNIFASGTVSILEYANNIDVHFINKRCQEYLKTANSIMSKDLHNMKEVGPPHDPNGLATLLGGFSRCCVSKSVFDLTTFLEKILQEAISASDVCAGRLYCTVQRLLEEYITFVPEYHKKLLQTIPQQVALYHNNCLYIAEKIKEWTATYSPVLASKLNIDFELFRDSRYILKTAANEMFTSYVETQIQQIEDIMKDVELKNAQSLDKLEPNTEKCIRQCLRQQELLKTVWGKVLSYQTYNKTIGMILDSFCILLVNAVIKLQDIPSSVAEQLVEVLKIIVTRGPKLFTDPKEVSLFVSSWYKFNELVFVLNSSLVDINDRWADGKGPLALQFKPEELKQLIRALFQNTDRRAVILAKII